MLDYTPNSSRNNEDCHKALRPPQLSLTLTLARAGYVIRRGVITYKSNNSTREVTRLIVRAGGDQ